MIKEEEQMVTNCDHLKSVEEIFKESGAKELFKALENVKLTDDEISMCSAIGIKEKEHLCDKIEMLVDKHRRWRMR